MSQGRPAATTQQKLSKNCTGDIAPFFFAGLHAITSDLRIIVAYKTSNWILLLKTRVPKSVSLSSLERECNKNSNLRKNLCIEKRKQSQYLQFNTDMFLLFIFTTSFNTSLNCIANHYYSRCLFNGRHSLTKRLYTNFLFANDDGSSTSVATRHCKQKVKSSLESAIRYSL